MNGILNAITAIQQWQSAGGLFKFDSAFSTAIGGYPKGAILASADGLRTWRNTVEANTTDPDGASPSGWISTMGNRQSLLAVSGSYAIQAGDLGKIIYVSSTAGASLILPAAGAVPIGSTISIINLNTGGVSVGRPASGQGSGDVIQYGNGTAPSSAILQGEFLELVSDGSAQWIPAARTTGFGLLPAFAAVRAASGYQKLPGGTIRQWGFANAGSDSNGATITFPIAFPTTALAVVATNTDANCAGGGAQIISASQFKLFGRLYSGVYAAYGFYWEAIGY